MRVVVILWCCMGAVAVAASNSCPHVCACKWKGGKQTVECLDRNLKTIPSGVHPETQVLDVTGNNLQILFSDMFVRADLLNLQKLYLRSCKIGQIEDRAFHRLTNLVELDLSHNLLTSIPSATFEDVPFLRDVTLAHNTINKIDGGAFRTLPGLVKLDLSHCELTIIAPRAFEGVEQLETLKLNANRLTELRPRTVESLSKLHGVELHDNPWFCDCRLRAAKLWLADHNIPAPVPPTCAGGPERLLHRNFGDLGADEFACKPEMLPAPRYVEATTGENASIVCRVRSVPQASVMWFWNNRQLVNNSVFGSPHQRVYIFQDEGMEMTSSLVLSNAQETDATEFYCVAENRAGSAEANFTLHVSMRTAGMATLGSGHIAGISVALLVLIMFILLAISVLFLRLRRLSFSESKTPGQVESGGGTGGSGNFNGNNVAVNAVGNSCKSPVTMNADNPAFQHGGERDDKTVPCNPVQKPPRLTEIPYTTSHYDGGGSVIAAPASAVAVSPTPVVTNNPDIIRDTRMKQLDACSTASTMTASTATTDASRSQALPSAVVWDSPNGSPDLFMRRTTSATAFDGTSDKTPIIGGVGGCSEAEDYGCRTLPRYPPDYGLPVPPPRDAKAARVWQRGVPVLPPVTALKRVLSRNSPDEGYQEGPGTDV